MTNRIRRMRSAANVVAQTGPTARQKAAMLDKLHLISEIQKSIAHHQKTIATASLELQEEMQKFGMTVFEGQGGEVGEITQSAGKGKNVIMPKTLRDTLKDDKKFFACVDVSVTKVKEFLSGKEFDKINTFIPGTPGEKKLKVFVKED